MDSALIYCREHKAQIRKQTVELLNAIKQREIERFVNNIQNCIHMEADKSSLHRQAIMHSQQIN